MRWKIFRNIDLYSVIITLSMLAVVSIIISYAVLVVKSKILSEQEKRYAIVRNRLNLPSGNRYISYQIHSYNDMREWNQLFHKNVTWMKLDLYYLPSKQCRRQERVKNDERGCFILNHDSPTQENSRNNFNSTNDLINMFSNPKKFSYFFKSTLFISLCVKFSFGDLCDRRNINGVNYISLMTDFLKEIQKFISEKRLDVHLILDGSATPGGRNWSWFYQRKCLRQLWRPLNSTFIVSKDPTEAMYSDDPHQGFDRFRIYNMKISDEVFYGPLDLGKFKSETYYPMLIWEPSDQKDIHLQAVAFLEFSYINVPLRFAINIDPVCFEVYSAQSKQNNGYAWNIFLDNTKNVIYHKIAPFPESMELFALIYQISDRIFFKILEGKSNFGNFEELSSGELPTRNNRVEVILFVETRIVTGSVRLSIGLSSGSIFEFQYGEVEKSFEYVRKISVSAEEEKALYSMERFEEDVFLTTSRSSDCSFSVNIRGYESYCLFVREQEDDVFIDVSTAISRFGEEVLILFNLPGHKSIKAAILSFFPKLKTLSLVHYDEKYDLNVGIRPQLSIVYDEVSMKEVVLETHENGFCYHTKYNNFRSDVGLCDLVPYPIEQTLVYNYGEFEEFRNHVVEKRRIDVCSEGSIVHGMFDQGSMTSSALYRCEENNHNKICLLESHKGVSMEIQSTCGKALIHDGLVVDSWILPKFL